MNNKLYVSIVAVFFGLFGSFNSNAQGMAVNTSGSAANSSAMLDVSSTDKGVLVPRMTETQRDAISSPATGLMVYQTDNTAGFYYYNGSAWTAIGGGGGAPSGAAGGSLAGTYPNPTLGSLVVTNGNLAANSVTTSKVADGTVTSAKIFDNSILNADVNAAAAIAYSKLNLSNSIVSGDLTAGSVTVAKISATGTADATTYLRGDGSWSTPAGGGGSTGTGASPAKIPYSVSGNTTITSGTPVYSPTNSVQQFSMANSGTIVVVAPTACTPTMTITSFLGVGMTWNLYSVTPNTTSSTFTLGTLLGSCTTVAASGTTPQVCVINASAVAAGTLITLSTAAVGTNYAFYKAFSCD